MDPRWFQLRWRARLESLRPDRELVALASTFRGKTALELGGPSALFRSKGRLPLYAEVTTLDAADYAQRTLWTSPASWDAGATSPRHNWVVEAGDLAGIEDASYDAVLASHVIEHLANPLAALREWQRVLRPGGRIMLVAPHREGTFDHRRPVTPIKHLLEDERAGTPESDLTHLPEILDLHDLARDPLAGDHVRFSVRSRENAEHRALHHHVFDTRSLVDAVEAAGFYVSFVACRRPYHVLVAASTEAHESLSREAREATFASSPFRSDRSAS